MVRVGKRLRRLVLNLVDMGMSNWEAVRAERGAVGSVAKGLRVMAAQFAKMALLSSDNRLIMARLRPVKGLRVAGKRQVIAGEWFLFSDEFVSHSKSGCHQGLSKNGIITGEF
jgi:hypothetical protein